MGWSLLTSFIVSVTVQNGLITAIWAIIDLVVFLGSVRQIPLIYAYSTNS